MSKAPIRIRETLEQVFPPWLVKLLGPYPEDVGRVPVFCKWFVVLLPWAWGVMMLVPEQDRDRFAKGQIIVGLIGACLAGVALWRFYRSRS